MEEVIVAAGSNLGDRLAYLQKAGKFLELLTAGIITKSGIWESEPVGDARFTFLNSAAKIETELPPEELLIRLKKFEQSCGREKNPQRWSPRVIDLDIIHFGNLVIQKESLIIPHPEYSNRLFVLLPMLQIDAGWCDPRSGQTIDEMINRAPEIEIHQTDHRW